MFQLQFGVISDIRRAKVHRIICANGCFLLPNRLHKPKESSCLQGVSATFCTKEAFQCKLTRLYKEFLFSILGRRRFQHFSTEYTILKQTIPKPGKKQSVPELGPNISVMHEIQFCSNSGLGRGRGVRIPFCAKYQTRNCRILLEA